MQNMKKFNFSLLLNLSISSLPFTTCTSSYSVWVGPTNKDLTRIVESEDKDRELNEQESVQKVVSFKKVVKYLIHERSNVY